MTIYALKPRFQNLLRPMVRWLAEAGATANQVTLGAAIGSVFVGLTVIWAAEARWVFLLLPLWFFIRMTLNAIDGMLAREFGQQSRLGACLNEICDIVSDAALYAPFAVVEPFGPVGIAVVVFLSTLSEFAGVLGPMTGASRRHDGPLGKSDRAFVFGALGFWIGIGAPLPVWLSWIVPIIAMLLIVTTVNRIRNGLRDAGP